MDQRRRRGTGSGAHLSRLPAGDPRRAAAWEAALRRAAVAAAAAAALFAAFSASAHAEAQTVNAPEIVSTTLPAATVGSPYATQLAATGGTGPYTWAILTGPVPTGLVLSSTGSLSGIPGVAGDDTISLRVTDAAGATSTGPVSIAIAPAPPPPQEIHAVTRAGSMVSEGTDLAAPVVTPLGDGPVVAIAVSPTGAGAWSVTATGDVIATGSVHSFGRLPARLARVGIAGIAVNVAGTGYWIVTRGGHVYGFGAAHSLGSLTGSHRHNPVVGIARTPSNGYLLLQASGHVTGFGAARSHGSIAARHRHVRVEGIASMPFGRGYWIVTAKGDVFRFGNARHYHFPARPPGGSVVAIVPATTGVGYYLVARDGVVRSYGSAASLPVIPVASGDHVVAAASSS